jgi:sigma-B regulation protein RsbU (phosphoserine phosphatase)
MNQPRIQVNEASGRRVVMIAAPRFTIGRRAENDLVLTPPEVSREHAEILSRGSDLVLRDLGSRVGTYVNGERVTERVLAHGDRLRFGGEAQPEHLFLLDAAASSAPRPTLAAAGELRQISALLEGLRALGSGGVLEEVLAIVLDSTLEVSGAERGFIMLANPAGALEFKLGRARGGTTLAGTAFEVSQRIPEEVYTTGEARLVADILDGDIAMMHQRTIQHGIRTVFCIPLRVARITDAAAGRSGPERPIGVLYLDSRQAGSLMSTTMRAALEALAREAAAVIENARLYRESLEKARIEEELRIAGEIQQALLPPRVHTGPGFLAAGSNFPCQAIGGDFFDYLPLPGECVGFALGDVAGKGPPAAILAAVVQGMFYSLAASSEGPAATLARMNRALAGRIVATRFATVAYAVLAPDGRLVSCNGGHNPPVVVAADGGIRTLNRGGLILGIFPEAQYEEEEVRLSPGDTFVLYSDGLNEAESADGEEFGEERVLGWLATHHALEPTALVDGLIAEVRAFARGVPQADDMTALAARDTGRG